MRVQDEQAAISGGEEPPCHHLEEVALAPSGCRRDEEVVPQRLGAAYLDIHIDNLASAAQLAQEEWLALADQEGQVFAGDALHRREECRKGPALVCRLLSHVRE